MYPFLFSVRVLFNPKSLITVTAWNFSGTWNCDAFSFDSCKDHSSRVDCLHSQKNHVYRSHIMSGVTYNFPLRVHSTRLINVGSAWKRKSRNPSYSLKRSLKLNHTSRHRKHSILLWVQLTMETGCACAWKRTFPERDVPSLNISQPPLPQTK